jgi:hypothetical protein
MSRSPELRITVVWVDPDLQEVAVSAASKNFSGETYLYAGTEELAQLADRIQGFPSSSADRRVFSLGQDGLSGYGTAQIHLYCTDGFGHLNVEVTLRTNPLDSKHHPETCVVQIPAVPSDIDRFEAELRGINGNIGQCAVLANAA